MKWAPLSADSLNKIPLFPIIPTGCPKILANPVTSVVPYNFLNSSNSLPSTIRSITDRISNCFLRSVGAIERSSLTSYNGSLYSWFIFCNPFAKGSFPAICKFLIIFLPSASAWSSS
ncbi:hypothetical protein V8G54_005092 [Vigna mungo]|uniref:Uncharacterized protein n=1 Tax=Vigna mungo TaxID=3915 RepID=A0AAQ3PDP6_VIGMU